VQVNMDGKRIKSYGYKFKYWLTLGN